MNVLASKPIPAYDSGLKNAGFSQCGNFLIGIAKTNGSSINNQVVRIAIPAIPCENLVSFTTQTEVQTSFSRSRPNTFLDISEFKRTPLYREEQSVQVIDDSYSLSLTEHYAEFGAIVLQEFNEGQNAHRSATLLRLPKFLNQIKLRAIITTPDARSQSLAIIVNKAPQDTYDLRASSSVKFPIFVQRQKDTLQAYTPPQRRIEAPPEILEDMKSIALEMDDERFQGISTHKVITFDPESWRINPISLWLAEFHHVHYILIASRQMLRQTSTQLERDRHRRTQPFLLVEFGYIDIFKRLLDAGKVALNVRDLVLPLREFGFLSAGNQHSPVASNMTEE